MAPTFHPAACIYHSDWQPLLEEDLARVGAWLAANPRGEVTVAAATAHNVRPVADAAGKKAPAGAGLPEEAAR